MDLRDEKTIFTQMINYAADNGLLGVTDETRQLIIDGKETNNQYIMDIATHSFINNVLETDIKEVYDNININTATGAALDAYGDLFKIPRIMGNSSLLELNIELPAPLQDNLIIPKGTKVLMEDVAKNGSNYITSEEVIITAGVTTATVIAESEICDVLPIIPRLTVTGLEGINDIRVTNENPSTQGNPIEEDVDYRKRLKNWYKVHIRGLKECYETFLNNYDGLDSYKLIPLYDGVGTLKIVCDAPEILLTQIAEDVYNNCTLYLDYMPVTVLPDIFNIGDFVANVTVESDNGRSMAEITQAIENTIRTFFNGGVDNYGLQRKGLSIGEGLNPAALTQYVLYDVPEVVNVYFAIYIDEVLTPVNDIITVAETEKLMIERIMVV